MARIVKGRGGNDDNNDNNPNHIEDDAVSKMNKTPNKTQPLVFTCISIGCDAPVNSGIRAATKRQTERESVTHKFLKPIDQLICPV